MNASSVIPSKERVLVLLSGGIDSAVCATKLHTEGKEIYGLSIRYPDGANVKEIKNATLLAMKLGAQHTILDFNFVDQLLKAMDSRLAYNIGGAINRSFLPGKVVIPIHLVALTFARLLRIHRIYWAIHKDDFDETLLRQIIEYLNSIETLLAEKSAIPCRFELPFIRYSKRWVVDLGVKLGVDFNQTHSCSVSSNTPCGTCRQCGLRAQAFGCQK